MARLLLVCALLSLLVPPALGLPLLTPPPENDAGTGTDAPEERDPGFLLAPDAWQEARVGGADEADVFALELQAAGTRFVWLRTQDDVGSLCMEVLSELSVVQGRKCYVTWGPSMSGALPVSFPAAGTYYLRFKLDPAPVGADTPAGPAYVPLPVRYGVWWSLHAAPGPG